MLIGGARLSNGREAFGSDVWGGEHMDFSLNTRGLYWSDGARKPAAWYFSSTTLDLEEAVPP
jgi:hypothetical protein